MIFVSFCFSYFSNFLVEIKTEYLYYPVDIYLFKSQQRKHQNNMWNLFKINN